MKTILYIDNEICTSLTQLQEHIKNMKYGSEVFTDILEYALCGDLTTWLREHDYEKLGDQIDSIDKSIGDSEYAAQLSSAFLLNVKPPINKPRYNECLSCDVSILSKNDKEVVVQLSIKAKTFINENFEIRISSGWGTKARVFNPSQHEENVVYNETITMNKRMDQEIGNVVVTIEGEKVFEENVQLPIIKNTPSLSLESKCPIDELQNLLKTLFEHLDQIKESTEEECKEIQSAIIETSTISESIKTESGFIRTAGGLMPKDEWMKKREQEAKARENLKKQKEEELKRKKEEEEQNAMIMRWRKRHGM